jgi:hypothetical protein
MRFFSVAERFLIYLYFLIIKFTGPFISPLSRFNPKTEKFSSIMAHFLMVLFDSIMRDSGSISLLVASLV